MSVSHQGAVVAGRVKRLAAAAVVAILFSVTPSGSPAGQGDCGQPVTDGLIASATDCLFILRASVGLNACPYDCICDTDGSSTISATDALACLQRAVGLGTHLLCACETPALLGLDPAKPPILPITVQAAYNDDTMFFHISWEGDRGDTHDYLHFTDGAWRNEGGHRRDGQATLDNDPARGATDRNSTIYESRATFMIDDPNGPNAVPEFDRYGCFMTCHDDNRGMPTWDGVTDLTKYLTDEVSGSLDLWHHRLHRANPIGASDDQFVSRIPLGGEAGGRIRDAGTSPWQTNAIDGNGDPLFAFDPADTGGVFAFKFPAVFTDPLRIFRSPDAEELGAGPVASGIGFVEAFAMGYVPEEGDAIPTRRLRTPSGSAGDITAFGTVFTPSNDDPLFGRWESSTQRLLDTGNPDDTALADGGVYNIGFAVHTGKVTIRDHYVSFPMTLSLGGGAAQMEAVRVQGSGREALPDFADAEQFPVTEINLFLPGIATVEFLNNEDTGTVFIDPQNEQPVDQNHGGAGALTGGMLGCPDCHTSASADPFEPVRQGGFFAGAMETLVPQRGGVNTPTPIPGG